MGRQEDQTQQHGMGQSGYTGNEQHEGEGSPSGGMEQGTSQVGTHANEQAPDARSGEQGEVGRDPQRGGGYGQDSGFDQTVGLSQGSGFDQTGGGGGSTAGNANDVGYGSHGSGGVGQPSGGDYGTESTGGAHQGDMTTDQMNQQIDPTRSGNTGWNDRSESEMDDRTGGSR